MELTHQKLKEILNYNPETGIFNWKIKPSKNIAKGKITGTRTSNNYGYIRINRKMYSAHRLAWFYMTGHFPTYQIDHINHIRNDNRFQNLREVLHCENSRNIKMPCTNTSGTVGVHWSKDRNKWVASIKIQQKLIHLGIYKDKSLAIKARHHAERIYKFHKNHGRKPEKCI